MKDENTSSISICPVCGQAYADRPALSRRDNETLICPDCGTREALATIGVDVEEQDEILAILHRTIRREQS